MIRLAFTLMIMFYPFNILAGDAYFINQSEWPDDEVFISELIVSSDLKRMTKWQRMSDLRSVNLPDGTKKYHFISNEFLRTAHLRFQSSNNQTFSGQELENTELSGCFADEFDINSALIWRDSEGCPDGSKYLPLMKVWLDRDMTIYINNKLPHYGVVEMNLPIATELVISEGGDDKEILVVEKFSKAWVN